MANEKKEKAMAAQRKAELETARRNEEAAAERLRVRVEREERVERTERTDGTKRTERVERT